MILRKTDIKKMVGGVGRTQARIDFVNFATILRWFCEFCQRCKICIQINLMFFFHYFLIILYYTFYSFVKFVPFVRANKNVQNGPADT